MRTLFKVLSAAAAGFACSALVSPLAAADLLFYSSVPRNLTEPLNKAFEAKNPGTKVTMFQAGTETLLGKMELEIQGKGKPEADVIWVQELTAMQRYAEKGLLVKYPPADVDKIAPAYRDPGGHFHGTFITHALLMYNSRALNDKTAPQTWQDLTQSRFLNKLTFADPTVSGTGAAVVSALVQNAGWEYWQKIAKNKPNIASGHPAMVSTIIAGERTAGPMLDYSIVEAVEKKQPIGFVFPKEGAIAVAAYVAIVNGTKAGAEARKFVDFFASKEAADLLQKRGMYHARLDAQPPKGWPAIGQIKTMPIDWKKHRETIDGIKKKFSEVVEK